MQAQAIQPPIMRAHVAYYTNEISRPTVELFMAKTMKTLPRGCILSGRLPVRLAATNVRPLTLQLAMHGGSKASLYWFDHQRSE